MRSQLILAEVVRSEADVLCLEEVDHFADWLEPQLQQRGFHGLFQPKPASPCLEMPDNNGPDGCALFYRASMFELEETRRVRLKDPGGVNSKQVAILARLRWRGGAAGKVGEASTHQPRSLCVAVTHLKAKSGFHDYRLAEGEHLRAEVAGFAGALPAIVCGDFNAPPQEPVYECFVAGEPDLASAYAVAGKGGEPEFTSWKLRPSGKESKYTIDYMWFTARQLSLTEVWSLPSTEAIGTCALPCPSYPSDHLALCASFQLCSPPA